MLARIVELLQTIRITDKERAFTVIEDAAWACKLAICRTFLAPLLNEFSSVIEVLDPLTFVGDGIFDGEDMVIFGYGHATNVVELACSSDAIAAPLIDKASICIEVLNTVRIHIRDNQRVVGECVDIGDGVELAFADTFSAEKQLLFATTCVASKVKLVSEPEGVV